MSDSVHLHAQLWKLIVIINMEVHGLFVLIFAITVCICTGKNIQKDSNIDPEVEEDSRLSTTELISKYGYPVEIHHVRTYDGYILEMHRIPHGVKSPAAPNKPVVFLQHGLLCSSSDWVLMGTEKGLAYIMADLGYDVWMGNSRGNTYSRKHAVHDPEEGRFWEFSWHEMGIYDLPAEIDYVLELTGQPNMFYIGHSQGTTQFYVMAAELPEYNAKIRAMFSLAPVGFMNHLSNPLLQLIAKADDVIGFALKFMGINEFLPSTELMANIGQKLCRDQSMTQVVCEDVLFLIAGWDSEQLNSTMIPVILGHTPAGASTRQLLHYAQEINSGNFEVYGGIFARHYDLSKITCPVALHYSENDLMSHPTDVDRLYKQISNPIGKFLVPLKKFNHLDYLWAIDVKTLVYNKIISLMTHYK